MSRAHPAPCPVGFWSVAWGLRARWADQDDGFLVGEAERNPKGRTDSSPIAREVGALVNNEVDVLTHHHEHPAHVDAPHEGWQQQRG